MAEWINFPNYEGFSILDDATKIKTPEGEFDLKPGKLFYFINPNTGTKNFAKPDVLLARAMKSKKEPKVKKEKVVKEKKETTKSTKLPNSSLKVDIKTVGLEAVQRSASEKCTLYYRTDKYGWQIVKWDPQVILEELSKPQIEGEKTQWFPHRFGIEN